MIRFSLLRSLEAAEGKMNLEVACSLSHGSMVALYGPSGVGKTSVLRMLAGLMEPEAGFIAANDQVWFDSAEGINVKPQARQLGFLFQDYALFPNMTIRQNLEFARETKKDQYLVEELIETAELSGLQDRYPANLSGGQQQRVALARALVRRPKLLLLDEPLSALDKTMRSKLQTYLKEVHQRFGLTTLLVSHDISEVFKLADEVIVLEKGKVVRNGSPEQVFGQRALEDRFQFTGEVIRLQPAGKEMILTLLAGSQTAQVRLPPEQVRHLRPGDQVIVRSSEFDPKIIALDKG